MCATTPKDDTNGVHSGGFEPSRSAERNRMSRSPRTMVGLFAVLLSVWVVVYWCYRRPEPAIRDDDLGAPPLEAQLLAALAKRHGIASSAL